MEETGELELRLPVPLCHIVTDYLASLFKIHLSDYEKAFGDDIVCHLQRPQPFSVHEMTNIGVEVLYVACRMFDKRVIIVCPDQTSIRIWSSLIQYCCGPRVSVGVVNQDVQIDGDFVLISQTWALDNGLPGHLLKCSLCIVDGVDSLREAPFKIQCESFAHDQTQTILKSVFLHLKNFNLALKRNWEKCLELPFMLTERFRGAKIMQPF